jgi:hypothetical protein
VRASAVRDTLAFLDKFEPGSRAKVMAGVPAASREVIETTPRSGWIAIEHDHHTIDGIIRLFGRTRAIQCWREALTALIERPLLGGFVKGMVDLFGRDPARVVALFPRAWPLVYRDVCSPRLHNDGRRPMIRFESIAAEVRTHPNYLHSWNGACQGFAEIARVHGHVEFKVAPDCNVAEAIFSWS